MLRVTKLLTEASFSGDSFRFPEARQSHGHEREQRPGRRPGMQRRAAIWNASTAMPMHAGRISLENTTRRGARSELSQIPAGTRAADCFCCALPSTGDHDRISPPLECTFRLAAACRESDSPRPMRTRPVVARLLGLAKTGRLARGGLRDSLRAAGRDGRKVIRITANSNVSHVGSASSPLPCRGPAVESKECVPRESELRSL